MNDQVLGLKVDRLSKEQTISVIADWLKNDKRGKQVVTLYSEFVVRAWSDSEFAEVINAADLVTPDGVSILAALDYRRNPGWWNGLRTGGKIVSGKVGETVTGVWLVTRLIREAAEKKWKVFVLGGFGDTNDRLIAMVRSRYPNLMIRGDAGRQSVDEDESEVLRKINEFKPDLLFVAYAPVIQEKWIARHKKDVDFGVAVGVGGTFDELVGKVRSAPMWMEKVGLKWLWRLMCQPKRVGRIWNAVVVFPWLVYRQSVRE